MGLAAAGLTPAGADAAYASSWWVHALLAFGLLAALPYTKAAHMVIDAVNLALARPRAFTALPRVSEGTPAGYRTITDFTCSWPPAESVTR